MKVRGKALLFFFFFLHSLSDVSRLIVFPSGLEHKLGSKTHDGAVRRRQYHIRVSVGRL